MKFFRIWKIVVALILVFAAGAVTGGVGTHFAIKRAFERGFKFENWTADVAGMLHQKLKLTAEQDPTLWKEIVALTVDTSIRRNVKPLGIPDDESCKAVAIHNAGAIPELAKLLGMKVPPPPPPTRLPRRPTTRRPPTRHAS